MFLEAIFDFKEDEAHSDLVTSIFSVTLNYTSLLFPGEKKKRKNLSYIGIMYIYDLISNDTLFHSCLLEIIKAFPSQCIISGVHQSYRHK